MEKQNRANLEARAVNMCWDWDVEDINLDKDDGKIWVPVTPKTLETADIDPPQSGQQVREPTEVRVADRTMRVYAVAGGPKDVVQASSAIMQVVQSPRKTGKIMVFANEESSDTDESTGSTGADRMVGRETKETEKGKGLLGKGERKKIERRKETPRGKERSGKAAGKTQVPRGTPVITSHTLREVPCDWCRKTKQECQTRTKGEIVLSACDVCHQVKTVCKTGDGARTGQTEHASAPTEEVEGAEGMPGGLRRRERLAALQAKARLESYCTSPVSPRTKANSRSLVPASVLSKKHKGPDTEPSSRKRTRLDGKRAHTWAEEITDEPAAMSGIEDEEVPQASESSLGTMDARVLESDASDELTDAEADAEEVMGSLQDETMMEGPSPGGLEMSALGLMRISIPELIIWDVWLNWEEDLRWAHWQRILTRAMTMWDNPGRQVEVRQLTAAETEWFVTWRSRTVLRKRGWREMRWVSGNEPLM